jgi:N-acetylmuramoyl-L-alanine amidase
LSLRDSRLTLAALVILSGVALRPTASATFARAANEAFDLHLAGAGQAAPRTVQPFSVISASGRRPLPATQSGDQWLVALDDLAPLFQLTVREDTLAGGVSVGYKNKTVVLTPGQPVASAGGRLVSLPAPLTRDGRRWLVPIDFISRALAVIYDTRLEVRKNSHLVLVGDVQVPRITVRQETTGGQARVTIDVSPRTPHTIIQEPNRLLVRFESDALDAMLPAFPPQGLLQAVRLADPATTIALDLGPRFASYRASVAPQDAASSQIVIDLMAAAEPAAPSFPRPATPPPVVPELPAPGMPPPPALRTIVLDAGHGGDETGARGPAGTAEKDVTLTLARRLKAAIEGRLGVRVLLTRDGDQAIALDDRAAVANNNKADLFVSLHANASVRKDASGAEIFYLSADQSGEEARRAAASRQSLPALGGGTRDIDMILWEMAQVRYLSDSAALAGAVEEQFRGRVRLNAHPVQQAPFRVLAGANMPAVLVEVGFLTNPDEEQQLLSEPYQAAIVQGLVDGILRYREVSERARQLPAGDRR